MQGPTTTRTKLLHINVYKEGAPETRQEICMRVLLEHAQSQWRSLIAKIERTLQIEDVEGIFEEYKMVPVYRILSIVDGGIYVARPTSNCALLRALCDSEAAEKFPGHPFIESMRGAKVDLKKKEDEWADRLPEPAVENGISLQERLKLLALPIDEFEENYQSIYSNSTQHPSQASEEDVATLELIQQVHDPSGLMDILRRSSPETEAKGSGLHSRGAKRAMQVGEDRRAGRESCISQPVRLSRKQARLLLMKAASLLARSAVHRSNFLKEEHASLVMAYLRMVHMDDVTVQYGLWILTHFARRAEFQAHLASLGLPLLLLKCLQGSHEHDSDRRALLLRVLIALYACLKLHRPNCQEHSAALLPAVISVLRAFEDSAKINLFGCWVIQEMVTHCDGNIADLEVVKHIQAIYTRFYDDELVRSAADELLSFVATSDRAEVVEARRLGVARGAIS